VSVVEGRPRFTLKREEYRTGGLSYDILDAEDNDIVLASCVVSLRQTGLWWITNLSVAARVRRLGLGGTLLGAVCGDADRNDWPLGLTASAFRADGWDRALDQESLEAFYARRGFVRQLDGTWRREPREGTS